MQPTLSFLPSLLPHPIQAFKAAEDAINSRPTAPGDFLFIGTRSHEEHVIELTTTHGHAFYGATRLDYWQELGRAVLDDVVKVLESPDIAL